MYHVFNFRGEFQAKFETQEDAKEYISKQTIPEDYYTDYLGNTVVGATVAGSRYPHG